MVLRPNLIRAFGITCAFVSAFATLVLLPTPLASRDYGNLGAVFPIAEPSILETIMGRLQTMEGTGELAAMKSEMQDTTRAYAIRPRPIGFVTKAETYRSFEVDLSITVQRDLSDHNGVVFARAGSVINPLDFSRFAQRLVLIDGDDPDQVAFALDVAAREPTKIILVSGEPLTLTEAHGVRFWFDQEAVFVKKFQVAHVPAVITRSYPNMIVEEILVSSEKAKETP